MIVPKTLIMDLNYEDETINTLQTNNSNKNEICRFLN